MDGRLSALRAWGCDVNGALERMLDDEAFLLDCVNAVLADPGFMELRASVQKGDASAAFSHAHALKGVLGNVGLTPMYDCVCRIVEPLRAGGCGGLTGDLDALDGLRDQLTRIMARA